MSTSVGQKGRIKIADVLPIEYEDFLNYCDIVGKTYADEILSVDYIAYRSQYGRSKADSKALKSVLENSASPACTSDTVVEIDSSASNNADTTEYNRQEDSALISEQKISTISEQIPQDADPVNISAVSRDSQIQSAPSARRSEPGQIQATERLQAQSAAQMPNSLEKSEQESSSVNISADDTHTYAQLLGAKASLYSDINLRQLYPRTDMQLSVRALNGLANMKCFTVADVLMLKPAQLRSARNLGKVSINEIERVLNVVTGKSMDSNKAAQIENLEIEEPEKPSIRAEIINPLVIAMVNGEKPAFNDLSDEELSRISMVQDAIEDLGTEFCQKLLETEKIYIVNTIEMFSEFSRDVEMDRIIVENAKEAVKSWNPEIYQQSLMLYLRLFMLSYKGRLCSEFRDMQEADVQVEDYAVYIEEKMKKTLTHDEQFIHNLKRFQKWMEGVNLSALLERLLTPKSEKDRAYAALLDRANGLTLEEIGKKNGVTRERIRQMEAKKRRLLISHIQRDEYNIFAIISIYRGGDQVLTYDEICKTIGEKYGNLLWYLAAKSTIDSQYRDLDTRISYYDAYHGVIVVSFDPKQEQRTAPKEYERIKEILKEIPDFIETRKLQDSLKEQAALQNIPEELLLSAASKEFKTSGIFSHRGGLFVVQRCEYILRYRFPNGYKIMDEVDGPLFQKYLTELFGEKSIMTCRAIDTKIMSLGVLVDRGKYMHKDLVQVDPSVMDDIVAFVKSNPKNAVPYVEIYTTLKDRLQKAGISNRYMLNGVMKMLGNPYTSRKDYIVKNAESDSNVADELNNLVREAGIIHKSEIFETFPGWKDGNIAMTSQRCPDVFSVGNGCYMHASILKIREEDRVNILKRLNSIIGDVPVSTRYLQDDFMLNFSDFMIDNKIDNFLKLFGILQYMYRDDFYFSAPYIAKENKGRITVRRVLQQMLEDVERIEIDDLVEMCSQNGIHFTSTASMLPMISPQFLRVDANTIMRYEETGLDEEMYPEILEQIQNGMQNHGGFLTACRVENFDWYPDLDIPWNGFLLESVGCLLQEEVHIIRMNTTDTSIPHAIFVEDAYKDDDWNTLLVKKLKQEHDLEPFSDKAEMQQWLQEEGLINGILPSYLEAEHHVFYDEDGNLRVE